VSAALVLNGLQGTYLHVRGIAGSGATPGGEVRFPGYDVLAQAPGWYAVTTGVVLGRLGPPPPLRFFTAAEEGGGPPDLAVGTPVGLRPVAARVGHYAGDRPAWRYPFDLDLDFSVARAVRSAASAVRSLASAVRSAASADRSPCRPRSSSFRLA
jgi:hypothetical protein